MLLSPTLRVAVEGQIPKNGFSRRRILTTLLSAGFRALLLLANEDPLHLGSPE